MHKCQGMAQLLALPGPSASAYQLLQSSIPGQLQRDEQTLFDNIDTTIPGLAQFVGGRPPRELTDGLSAIASAVQTAQKKFDTDADDATVQPLVNGLRAVRSLRAALRGMATIPETARFEISTAFARRSVSSSRRFWPATASASKRSPTTVWSCLDKRCEYR